MIDTDSQPAANTRMKGRLSREVVKTVHRGHSGELETIQKRGCGGSSRSRKLCPKFLWQFRGSTHDVRTTCEQNPPNTMLYRHARRR